MDEYDVVAGLQLQRLLNLEGRNHPAESERPDARPMAPGDDVLGEARQLRKPPRDLGVAHERPLAMTSVDQTPADELRDGLTHRHPRHAKGAGEVVLGRQLIS